MAKILVDTYSFIERLLQAGMAEPQARAVADGLREIDLDNVASKDDISALRSDLKDDISALRGELKDNISGLRGEVKDDISALKGEVKDDISGLRGELFATKADLEVAIAEVKVDLLKWLVPLFLGQAGLITALVKLL